MTGIMKDREIIRLNGDAIDEAAAMAERIAKLPKGILIKNDSMKIEICEAGGTGVKVKGKIISYNFMWKFKDGESTLRTRRKRTVVSTIARVSNAARRTVPPKGVTAFMQALVLSAPLFA
jgi:hypothetical protein